MNIVAVLDRNNKVIGRAYDVSPGAKEIEIAGAFTIQGDPVNVRAYKISRSKKNLLRAEREEAAIQHGDVYKWYAI